MIHIINLLCIESSCLYVTFIIRVRYTIAYTHWPSYSTTSILPLLLTLSSSSKAYHLSILSVQPDLKVEVLRSARRTYISRLQMQARTAHLLYYSIQAKRSNLIPARSQSVPIACRPSVAQTRCNHSALSSCRKSEDVRVQVATDEDSKRRAGRGPVLCCKASKSTEAPVCLLAPLGSLRDPCMIVGGLKRMCSGDCEGDHDVTTQALDVTISLLSGHGHYSRA